MMALLAVEAASTAASTTATAALIGAVDWWRDVNESPLWQDRIFHALAVLYGVVSVIALVSLSFPPPCSIYQNFATRSEFVPISVGTWHNCAARWSSPPVQNCEATGNRGRN
jgi:hypothetical protein